MIFRRFQPILLLILLIQGCSAATQTSTSPLPPVINPSIPVKTATASPNPPTPTPTPVPLAARVNGEGITLAEFQEELKRYEAAQAQAGKKPTPEEGRKRVLDDLIDQVLLAQAADQGGFKLDETGLRARIDQLAQQMGGADKLADWQKRNGYTPESFRLALRRAAAAAWQRDQVIAAVPESAEQVHARQILVFDAGRAEQILGLLKAGGDFAALAAQYYDPDSRGDLGWFPRGYLTQPEIETVAFNLQPGQYSQVIKTSFGYHLVQVIERDPKRQLSAEARRTLQHQALQKWLAERRAKSEIVITSQ